jgi:hypothetical protein
VFRTILESSRLPPTIPQVLHDNGVDDAWVGSLGGCLARSLLGGDVFPHGAMRWMGWPPLYTGLWCIAAYQGDWARR